MDEVDEYLWEVYQRVPIKKDRGGDFTWKDPAAAKRVNMSLQDYVIRGMDRDFREQLYHAGQAMDSEGVRWSMLSAFRDDYRQGIATGFKARVGNSLHGGSRATGGYGKWPRHRHHLGRWRSPRGVAVGRSQPRQIWIVAADAGLRPGSYPSRR